MAVSCVNRPVLQEGEEKQELEEGAPVCWWGQYQIELEILESVCGRGRGRRDRLSPVTKGNFNKEDIISSVEP